MQQTPHYIKMKLSYNRHANEISRVDYVFSCLNWEEKHFTDASQLGDNNI